MGQENRGLLKLIILRMIVFSSLLVAAAAIQESTSIFLPLDKFYFLTGAVFVLSIVYLLLYYWGKGIAGQASLQVALDLAMVTALVYITGGISGPLQFAYVLPILGSSLVLSSRGVYLTASASAIIFGLLVEGLFYRVIPLFRPEHSRELSFGYVLYSLVVAWCLFFAIAFLITMFSRNLRLTREELDRARHELQVQERQALAGRISSEIAHEIRNPLAAIAGSVQVLKGDLTVPDEHRKLMDIVVRESERISQTIEQFLDLAGPPRMAPLPVDLAAILKETLVMLQQGGELNGRIVVDGNFEGQSLPYQGNPHHFKQLFLNLIKNAIKAMPRGGLLRLTLERLRKNGARLVFADTGVGMSPETLEHIFEPFYSRFENGRGLGMAVVRRIVDDYRGTISLKSELGRGTEIAVTFPPPARLTEAAAGSPGAA